MPSKSLQLAWQFRIALVPHSDMYENTPVKRGLSYAPDRTVSDVIETTEHSGLFVLLMYKHYKYEGCSISSRPNQEGKRILRRNAV